MDWKLFASTFGVVFLAELGDKTQLSTMTLAASTGARWVVFAGAAVALISSAGLAVIAGEVVLRVLPPVWLRRARERSSSCSASRSS